VTKADLVLGPTQQVTDTRTYTGFGELRTYTAAANGTTIYSEDITARDGLGRITAVTETVDDGTTPAWVMSRTYEYDPEGRLWKVDGSAITYGYDANGNRTERLDNDVPTVTAEYDAEERLTELNATVYIYTANGELETTTTPGDDVTRYTSTRAGTCGGWRRSLRPGVNAANMSAKSTATNGNRAERFVGGVPTATAEYDAQDRLTALDGTGAATPRRESSFSAATHVQLRRAGGEDMAADNV